MDASANLMKIKDTIKAVIDRYGKSDIRYSVIAFGNTPSIKVRFLDSEVYDTNLLKMVIDAFPRNPGTAVDKALGEAKEMFQETARPDAKKVLVVIMDQKQSSRRENAKKKAQEVHKAGIKIIPVALGGEVNPDELAEITANKDNMVEMKKDEDPEKAVGKIMKKVLEGWSNKFLIIFSECIFSHNNSRES